MCALPGNISLYQHPGVLWAISPDTQISVRLIHTTDWRKKVKKTKSEKLAILRRYSLSGEFLAIFDPLLAIFSKNPNLPRFALLWDDSTIFLGEI